MPFVLCHIAEYRRPVRTRAEGCRVVPLAALFAVKTAVNQRMVGVTREIRLRGAAWNIERPKEPRVVAHSDVGRARDLVLE